MSPGDRWFPRWSFRRIDWLISLLWIQRRGVFSKRMRFFLGLVYEQEISSMADMEVNTHRIPTLVFDTPLQLQLAAKPESCLIAAKKKFSVVASWGFSHSGWIHQGSSYAYWPLSQYIAFVMTNCKCVTCVSHLTIFNNKNDNIITNYRSKSQPSILTNCYAGKKLRQGYSIWTGNKK